MNILFVFLIIFAVLFLILSVKISFCAEFYNVSRSRQSVYVRIGFFKYNIFPVKVKPKKNVRDSKKKKPKKVKAAKKEENPDQKAKLNIREIIQFFRKPLIKLLAKFRKYLRIEAADINIIVAEGDPLKTAVTFGAVSQSVWYTKALLEHNLNSKVKNITLSSDFLAEKTKFDINLKLSIRFYQILSVSFTSAVALVRWMMRNKGEKVNKNSETKG